MAEYLRNNNSDFDAFLQSSTEEPAPRIEHGMYDRGSRSHEESEDMDGVESTNEEHDMPIDRDVMEEEAVDPSMMSLSALIASCKIGSDPAPVNNPTPSTMKQTFVNGDLLSGRTELSDLFASCAKDPTSNAPRIHASSTAAFSSRNNHFSMSSLGIHNNLADSDSEYKRIQSELLAGRSNVTFPTLGNPLSGFTHNWY